MQVKDVLRVKGGEVVTIEQGKTVQDAVDRLVDKNIGALVVVDSTGKLAGIISERDVLRESSRAQLSLRERRVRDVMTKAVTVGNPDDAVKAVQRLMLERRIRHLPILANGALVGIVSIGDIMKALLEATEAENYDLRGFLVEKNLVD